MGYYSTSIDVDVNLDDVLSGMGKSDVIDLVADLLAEGYVPSGWSKNPAIDLSDSAVLLDVIVELRRMGYTVEPGGK